VHVRSVSDRTSGGPLGGFVHDGAELNPGGSSVPGSGDLARELRWYKRHRGDHVARYRWVAGRIAGGRVLDVGCGHGFGAAFLAPSVREYVGLDVDADAIAWASSAFGRRFPHATFLETSDVPEDGKFDAVVCFEVLEHVRDPARLLANLRSAAAPGAPVFVSTPNGSLSDGRPAWFMSPFHLAEFTASQFVGLLDRAFGPGGECFVQSRVDGLDWLPQALRLGLATSRGARSAHAAAPSDTTPSALRAGHALLRRVPSPAALWKLRPLPAPLRDGIRYSHLLWVGRRPARGPE
jgi:SAM-dependent methyltransferase